MTFKSRTASIVHLHSGNHCNETASLLPLIHCDNENCTTQPHMNQQKKKGRNNVVKLSSVGIFYMTQATACSEKEQICSEQMFNIMFWF